MEEKSELENFLAHHGVKGMKWGVRKDRKTGAFKPSTTMTRRDQKRSAGISRIDNTSLDPQSARKALKKSKQRMAREKGDYRAAKRFVKVLNDSSSSTRGDVRFAKGRQKDAKRDLKLAKQEYKEAKKAVKNADIAFKPYEAAFRKSRSTIKKGISSLNTSDKYAGQNFLSDSPIRKQYYADVGDLITNTLNSNATANKNGYTVQFSFDPATMSFPSARFVKSNSMKHTSEDNLPEIHLEWDEDGYIVDIDISEIESYEELKHSSEPLSDFLAHHGIKGMKWGIRKSRDGTHKPTAQVLAEEGKTKRPPKNATFVITNRESGKNASVNYNPRKVSIKSDGNNIVIQSKSKKEMRKVADAIRKADSSTKKDITQKVEMTDEQLRDAISRLELERRYKQLTTQPKKNSAVTDFMVKNGSTIAANAVTQVGTEVLKKALHVNYNKVASPAYQINMGKKKS